MGIQASQAANGGQEPQGYVRLHGQWPLIIRGLWGVVVILSLAISFSSLPLYLAQLSATCAGADCEYQQLTQAQVETLKAIGLSLGDYAVFTAALTLSPMAVCLAVSALIIWRKPDDRMAALVALMLATLGAVVVVSSLPTGPTPWLEPYPYLTFLFLALFAVVFSLFPTGRFAPRWVRWVLALSLIAQIPGTFLPFTPSQPDISGGQVGWLVAVIMMVALLVGQVIRYWRVSSPTQRQQTKWVVAGLAGPIVMYASMSALAFVLPEIAASNPLVFVPYNEMGFLLPLLLPIGFGFAMLRYRLWDVDALINRALVYGALTLILSAIYIGLVIGLQTLLRGVISQDNSVAIVLSTLAIAALFLPLRQRLQTLIDRRFYRRKYDAEKTLRAFSATLRDEIRVESLRERLLDVVDEVVQPAHISLWLRPLPREDQPEM